MNEIIVDRYIFKHLIADVADNVDRYDFNSESVKNDILSQNENLSELSNEEKEYNQLKVEGKLKVRTTLGLDEYKNFVDEIYNELKFIRKMDEKSYNYNRIFGLNFYQMDPNLIELQEGEPNLPQLSSHYDNSIGFELKLDNDSLNIHAADAPSTLITPHMRVGCINIRSLDKNEIRCIKTKNLPLRYKNNLFIHPLLNKKLTNNDVLDRQFGRFYYWGVRMSSPIPRIGKNNDHIWDSNDKNYEAYILKQKKLLPKIQKIHEYEYFNGIFFQEINFRIDLDSFNEHFSMIELYTKPVDQLTNINYLFYSEDINENEQAELGKSYERKYKKFLENNHIFPISFFIRKKDLSKLEQYHGDLFNSNNNDISFFDN